MAALPLLTSQQLDMPPMQTFAPLSGVLGVVAIMILVACFWLGVMALIATVGGWGALAREYPGPDTEPEGTTRIRVTALSFGGGPISLGQYRNIVRMTLTGRGFELRLPGPFRFMHPPIGIPWRGVRAYEVGKTLGQTYLLLTLANQLKLRIYGRAATSLVEAMAAAADRQER